MRLLDALYSDDICASSSLVAVVLLIGHVVCAPDTWPRYRGRQIGWIAMILFALWRIVNSDDSLDQWMRIAVRAPLAGGLGLGLAWIVMPGIAWVHERWQDVRRSIQRVAADQRRLRQQKVQQREAEAAARRASAEWERSRPERERVAQQSADRARLDAERREHEEQKKHADRKRREAARLRCLLAYDRFGSRLDSVFQRERLTEYFNEFFTNSYSPDEIEERASKLIAVLDELGAEQGDRSKGKFKTLSDVVNHFVEQRRQVRELQLDTETMESLETLVNESQDSAIARFLKGAMR